MSNKLRDVEDAPASDGVACVGNGNKPCGYVGGWSGGVCPECGGMLLSRASRNEAVEVVKELMKRMSK
jgi:hypothetical protein